MEAKHTHTHTLANQFSTTNIFSHELIVQQRVERGRKMLQGVQFAIHVSYLYELRAESAGVDTSTPPYHPHTFIQMCRKGQGGADISSLVNLVMQ